MCISTTLTGINAETRRWEMLKELKMLLLLKMLLMFESLKGLIV